ncbi:MAG: hypothetical protein QM730_01550 [Anaerolineales bacterium]
MKYPLTIEFAIEGLEAVIKNIDGQVIFRANGYDVMEKGYSGKRYTMKIQNFSSVLPILKFMDARENILFVLQRNRPFSFYSSWHNVLVNGDVTLKIREGKALGKVLGGLFDGTPFERISSEVWNPAFIIWDSNDREILTLDKKRKFPGSRYKINKIHDATDDVERIALLSLFGLFILERRYRY